MSVYTEIAAVDAPSGGILEAPSLTLTGYRALEIVVSGLTMVTDDNYPVLRFSVAGVFATTGYRMSMLGLTETPDNFGDGYTSGSGITLCSDSVGFKVGNASGEDLSSIICVDDPLSTTRYKRVHWESFLARPSGHRAQDIGGGIFENTAAIDGVRVVGQSNIVTGKLRVYGKA